MELRLSFMGLVVFDCNNDLKLFLEEAKFV